MNFSVIQFPGSNCDQDCLHVVKNVLGYSGQLVWHKDTTLSNADAVIVPGGFSYGDYLRCGAIAKCSPIMDAVIEFANQGGLVLGICNGFQILTESGLLPGGLVRNRDLKFICQHVYLKPVNMDSSFNLSLKDGDLVHCPIAHGEGCYYIDGDGLSELKENNQILWQYSHSDGTVDDLSNPNGSIQNIAGVSNKAGNVAGLMPHPERASESVLGETSGLRIFESMAQAHANRSTLSL